MTHASDVVWVDELRLRQQIQAIVTDLGLLLFLPSITFLNLAGVCFGWR